MSPIDLPLKAAIILLQLDEARANAVLRAMSEADATAILQQVARLPYVHESLVTEVIGDLDAQAQALSRVRQGGLDTAKKMLTERFGPAKAEELLMNMDTTSVAHPLSFLNEIDPGQIVSYTAREHPQTLAIIVAHLESSNAARVMEMLPVTARADVARRVATMRALPPDVLRKVSFELESRLASFASTRASGPDVGGIEMVVSILNSTDRATEKQILADLEDQDPEIAEAIRNLMFVFDDLLNLTDPDLQLVLRNVPVNTIAMASKGKDRAIFERFKRNLSSRNAVDLEEEFEALGAQRQSLVEAAEAEIIRQARALADAGDINIERGEDELIA